MTKNVAPIPALKVRALPAGYVDIRGSIVELVSAARHAAARNMNALMTARYWEIDHRIVEAEQKGRRRAGYGKQLIERLSIDLTQLFGRGFSADNLDNMRRFFLANPVAPISETASRELPKLQTVSGQTKKMLAAPAKMGLPLTS
jgi:hypothetical protein